jgi:hypothetical protein
LFLKYTQPLISREGLTKLSQPKLAITARNTLIAIRWIT